MDTHGPDLKIRAMTQQEFSRYRRRTISEYAAEHVRAGTWSAEEAEQRAAKQTDDLLPDGADTEGMVLLVGETPGEVAGMVWVGPAPDERAGWWIYDIQVVPARRRRGYGWALLDAAEREAQRRGADAIGLNVFGGNTAALGLYESSGYHVAAIRMRKPMSDRVIRHAAESRGDRKRSDGLSRPVVTTREPQAGRNNRSRFVDHVDRDLGPALGLWASLGAAPAAY